MPPKAPEASNGDEAEGRKTAAAPRVELARLRDRQREEQDEVGNEIMRATLLTCGELGYRRTTVERVLERYGGYRLQFYRHFANLGECYAAAYEKEARLLCDELLRAGAAEATWQLGLRAALHRLAVETRERPTILRALLIDVHIAGEPAISVRNKLLERLSRAIDRARRESGSSQAPPPLAAAFMVSAIEAAVVSALASDEPHLFAETVPELAHLVVAAFLGDEAARAELEQPAPK
jgi:AcrR family transcriptional regulator